MKQLGMAVLMYADDYDQCTPRINVMFPAPGDATEGDLNGPLSPFTVLGPYVKNQQVMMSVLAHQYPKTYVRVGDAAGTVPDPVGRIIEIVPTDPPGDLTQGDRLHFKVLFNGRPLEGEGTFDATWLGYSTAPEDYAISGELRDGQGIIDLVRPGVWYIRCGHMVPAEGEQAEKCRHMLYNAQLVLYVQPDFSAPMDSHGG